MGKLYTLDGKLLTETPEVRIGEKIYPVDDRAKTVKRLMAVQKDMNENLDSIDEALKLALGEKAYKEIDPDNMHFQAVQELFAIVLSAMTGGDPRETRFPDGGSEK